MPIPAAILPAIGFAKSWWKAAVGFLIAAPLFFLLGQCDGKRIERNRAAAARAEANVEALKTNAKASESAAAERVRDATEVNHHEERLIDAIESTPDEAPDAVRVRLGCERLRAQGADTTAIAACR